MLETIKLFTARQAGYHNYRVPGIVRSPGGVILASAEARRGGGGDWDRNDILLRRSFDHGATWGERQVVVDHAAYGPGPVSNFVMISDTQAGVVHALYCHSYARVFALRSTDDGATFTEPVEITAQLLPFRERYPWRVIATGPGHGIQLRNGRLLVPIWMSDGSGSEFGPGHLGHRPSCVATIYSDDHGATWACGEIFVHTDDCIRNPSETLAVELSDGRVLCNIRSEAQANRRLIAISPDGTSNWSTPVFDQALLEPVCMASLLRLKHRGTAGATLFLFANPDNLENELTPAGGTLHHDRKRLTVKLSTDECQRWPVARILEAGPAGYSDLAEAADGTILCIYECGMIDRMTDTHYLMVARFDLAWVERGAV